MVSGGSLGTDRPWWMEGGGLRAENGQWHESKKSRFRQSLVDGGSLGTDNGR